ncbi:MAG TPA: hypothetical protein VFK80_05970 [Limnochordia bacterium]|nr:hypothetical protein [Limnochordia bacterium]
MPFDTSGDRSRSASPGGNGRAGARVLTLQPPDQRAPYLPSPHDPQLDQQQQQQQQQAPWSQAAGQPQTRPHQAQPPGQMQQGQLGQMQPGQMPQGQAQPSQQPPQSAVATGTGLPPQLERALEDQQWKLEWEGFSESVVDAIEAIQYRLQQVEQKLSQQQQMQSQGQSQHGGQQGAQPSGQQSQSGAQQKQQKGSQQKQQDQQQQKQQDQQQQKQQQHQQGQQPQQQQSHQPQPQQQQPKQHPVQSGGSSGANHGSQQPGLGGPVGRLRSLLNKGLGNGDDAQASGQQPSGQHGGESHMQPAHYVLWDSGGISGPYADLQDAQNALHAGEHQAAGGGLRSPNAVQSAPGAGRIVGNGADSAPS